MSGSSLAYQVTVKVVHHNFDDFAIFEDVWIDVSINCRVRNFSLVDSERRVESRHLGT